MIQREDFTDDEWYRLRSAPWQAAMGVIEVDPSGGIAEGREIEAVEAELGARQLDEDLIGLVSRDLLDRGRSVPGDGTPSTGRTAAPEATDAGDAEDFPTQVVEAMASLRALLDAKAPHESEPFRVWLFGLASTAAEAGREGFAGITGPRVSETEVSYLDRLRDALGL